MPATPRTRALAVAAAAAALAVLASAASAAPTLFDPSLAVSTRLSGLDSLTGMAFLPGDASHLFVIEKNTGQVLYASGNATTTALDLNVANDSERGLLGITLAPDFATATNKYVYLYYSATTANADGGTWTENRVARYTWNGSTLTSPSILTTFPAGTGVNGPNHNGGPLTFYQGALLGSIGDLNRNGLEQNYAGTPSAGSGVLYRIDPATGAAAADNPFITNPSSDVHRWYAYGVRNSFGLAIDPVTGQLWDTENGPDFDDEINVVPAGFNSGWETQMGPGGNPADLVMLPNAVYHDPQFTIASPIGITDLAFLAGSSLDTAYHDAVIFGSNNTGDLYTLTLNAARDGFTGDTFADTNDELFTHAIGTGFGVSTDIQVGPDGNLYVLDLYAGKLYEISPVPEPASLGLLEVGLISLLRRRRRQGCGLSRRSRDGWTVAPSAALATTPSATHTAPETP